MREEHCLVSALVVDFAEELVATLMHGFDLSHWEVEVDRQDHYFVALDPHDDGEDNETREHYEDAEEDKGAH